MQCPFDASAVVVGKLTEPPDDIINILNRNILYRECHHAVFKTRFRGPAQIKNDFKELLVLWMISNGLAQVGWHDIEQQIDIGTILIFGPVVGAVLCWIGYFVFAFQMIRSRKPDADPSKTGWNWFNLLLVPSLLTEKGLRARRRCFLCMLGFPLCLGATWGISAIL